MGVRVLVVEDEDQIADYLIRGLREEGYTAERAEDGSDGWHHLKTGSWDVVLLDWWLPVSDGLTLLRQFRKIDSLTPVIMLTAKDTVADRVRGLDGGANDYLCKPFSFEELLARIRVVTRLAERTTGTTLSFGDLQIDLSTQKAMRLGRKLDLTAKEYSLLVFFLRHPNEVLTRTRLYEGVWDERYDGISNTLEAHVKSLRKKLEVSGERLIHTLRHRGYSFGDALNHSDES